MRRILTVGIDLVAPEVQQEAFDSKMSLLDWDIILLTPEIGQFHSYSNEHFQGKPSLSDSASFRLRDCCEHWRREIRQAIDAGKTVIVFLPALQEVFVDTGQRSYSGTGRNRRTTRHVELYSNFNAIPVALSPISATGSSMKLTARGAELLAAYWSEFEDTSRYQVILDGPEVPACVLTRAGDKVVGAVHRSKTSPGTLLLLPELDLYREEFRERQGLFPKWNTAGERFCARVIAAVVSLDKALRSTGEVTPEPIWATDSMFVLKAEIDLRVQLLDAEREVEQSQKRKESVLEELHAAGAYRALLFEKGKPLENVIIDALRLFGFSAAPYKDSESEFDVVFESEEGRLIGEAEGKDSKAINIDKLRQLAMNIHEDLQREKTTAPAKAVLFGNGFRLAPLTERADPFTDKCRSAAASSSTALVFTPDMFRAAQYLLGNADPEYARLCRYALLQSTGRVVFPVLPTEADAAAETRVDS